MARPTNPVTQPKPAAAVEIAPTPAAVAEKPAPVPTETPQALQTIQTAEAQGATARQVLAEIAPQKEKIDGLLQEASQLLFAMKDARILLTTLATEVAHNTPLGRELRRDALSIIEDLKLDKAPKETQERLVALQKKIRDAELPARIKPEDSQFFRFLTNYNRAYPDQVIPKEYLADILSGELDISKAVNLFLKQDKLKNLSAIIFASIKGDKAEMKIPTTPEGILKSADIEINKDNLQKLKDLLKEKASPVGNILNAFLMMLMFSQVVQMGEGEPAPSH